MILSFDPGVTSGLALLENNGDLIYTAILGSPEEINNLLQEVKNDKAFKREGIVCVAEEGPIQSGNYRPHIQEIEEMIKKHFPDVHWVPPGQWKGHPASNTSELVGRTQHEKDAVGLGRWFRKTQLSGKPE